mgnify:CR=1 FL=1
MTRLATEALIIDIPGRSSGVPLNLAIEPGQVWGVLGPNGVGKTTLLRTVAGLWSYAQGEIFCPQHNTLFLSQRPYLPQGNLLTALYYPSSTENADFAEIKQVLEQVQLAHLQDRLEQEQDWSRILSLGEQQRLAFDVFPSLKSTASLTAQVEKIFPQLSNVIFHHLRF